MQFKNLEIELNRSYKYKELCEIFGEQKKSGKGKILQFEKWKRYFNIENGEKATFIITEIYETPKEKIDNRGKSEGSRGNNEGISIKYSIPLMLDYFQCCLKNNQSIIYTTSDNLAKVIGIINDNYFKEKNDRKKYGEYINDESKTWNYTTYCDVLNSLSEIVRQTILGTLEKLQKNEYINYVQTYLISYKMEDDSKEELKIRIATNEEIKIIYEVEEEVLAEMGLDNTIRLQSNSKLKNKYYKKTSEMSRKKIEEELREKIEWYYVGFEIKILDKDTEEIENMKELKTKLNDSITERALGKINNKKYNAEKELKNFKGFGKPILKKWYQDRLKDNYIAEAEEMIKYLVKL